VIGEIENAIIETIRNASGMAYLKTVASYGGQFDDDIGKVIRAYPAVWVVYAGGGKPVKVGPDKWRTPANFAVMVAARNVRNEAATRKGDANEVGTYQILKDVRNLIINQDLGLEITRLEPGAVRTLYNTVVNGKALSVFSQEWSTAYIDKVPTPAELDLLKVGFNYYLQPDDNVVDATDVIAVGP
jgi:phage gp37-like protein